MTEPESADVLGNLIVDDQSQPSTASQIPDSAGVSPEDLAGRSMAERRLLEAGARAARGAGDKPVTRRTPAGVTVKPRTIRLADGSEKRMDEQQQPPAWQLSE